MTNTMKKVISYTALMIGVVVVFAGQSVTALTPLPEPDPVPGSYGLEATKPQPAPTVGATITTPAGGSFSASPIDVSGICPDGLLVQLHNNGVMVGAVMCEGGSFQISVSLFAGENELQAFVYDDLGQVGPASNTVTYTYTNTSMTAFGELVTLTSSFGRRSAPTGNQLSWPLQLSGGTGPYAFSIDWGDGGEVQLVSQSMAGVVNVAHAYKQAGIYQMNVRVTDANGVSAFLQLIAVSSGQVDPAAGIDEDSTANESGQTQAAILWAPTAVAGGLLLPAYFLGRQSQIVSLRNKMLKERDSYQKK